MPQKEGRRSTKEILQDRCNQVSKNAIDFVCRDLHLHLYVLDVVDLCKSSDSLACLDVHVQLGKHREMNMWVRPYSFARSTM